MKTIICTPSKSDIDFFSSKFGGSFDLKFFDRNLDDEILREIEDCEIFSGRIYSKVDEKVLEKLPNLKYIVTHSTGFDHIDIEECKKRNILVLNVPSYGERSIAEFGLGLIISMMKNIHLADRKIQKNNFDSSDLDGEDIFGKTIGIIGTGKIGKEMIKISKAIGANVLAYDVFEDADFARVNDFKYVSLDELLSSSDVISLHVPNLKETHHMINQDAFSKMKNGSYILNTARGAVIDIEALIESLKNGKIKGAALDVIEYEKVLFSKEEKEGAVKNIFAELGKYNVLYTPHMAAHSKEAQQKKLEIIAENIMSCIDGNPKNIIA